MAIITKIRNQSGLLIGAIGVAMVLFVAGDILSSGNGIFNKADFNLAVIGGKTITLQDFEIRVQAELGPEQSDESSRENARNRVWNRLLQEEIMFKEYAKLGITVTAEEILDQIQNNPSNTILNSYFTDPQTGRIFQQFQDEMTGGLKAEMVIRYINSLLENDQEDSWIPVEDAIKMDRLNNKYNTLIKKSLFTSSLEAEMQHYDMYKKVNFSYVLLDYSLIQDSAVVITDKDLKNYYSENKHLPQFKQEEESRGIQYVVFDVNASENDVNSIYNDLASIKQLFIESEDDSSFVDDYSETKNIQYFSEGSFPFEVDSLIFNSDTGSVFGPYKDGDKFVLSKILDKKFAPDSVNARHILLNIVEGDTATAMAKADSLKNILKRNKMFEILAAEHSQDLGSAQKGGNLDWFTEGTMVPEFNDACFEGKVGDMPIVVTQFGVHLIEILNQTKLKPKVLVANVEREIIPSKATFDLMYNTASAFSLNNTTPELFNQEGSKYKLQNADYFRRGDKFLGGLESPREVIRWTFESNLNDVSKPFEIGSSFVVARVTFVRSEGQMPFEEVKEMIRPDVIKKKKGEMLAERLKGSNSLDEIATKNNMMIANVTDVNFASFSIPSIGPEPELLGKLFGLAAGAVSQPIVGNNGVYVARVDQIIDAPPFEKTNIDKTNSTAASRVDYEVFNALKENAKVKDFRYKFF